MNAPRSRPSPRDLLSVGRVGLSEASALVRAVATVALDRGPLPDPLRAPGLPPVVLVHGWMASSSVLRPLARRLLAEGVPAVALADYGSVTARLEDIVDTIAARAAALATTHGHVDVVAHSLGAFATRVWLKRFGGDRFVRRFVSLGGPHAGTALHPFMPGALRGVLDPGGRWVREVNEGPEPVPTYVIRARLDHQVVPPVAARIEGTAEVVLDGHGHNALLFAREAHDAVVAALRGAIDDAREEPEVTLPGRRAAGGGRQRS